MSTGYTDRMQISSQMPFADDICKKVEPEMRLISKDRYVSCHKPLLKN